jgi:hypothetical protein
VPFPRSLRPGTRALEIAESLNDTEYQLRSLWGLWSFHIGSAQHRLDWAQRFYTVAAKQSDSNDRLIGERMIAISQYYLGDLSSARQHIEQARTDYVLPARRLQIIRFQADQGVTERVFLARILWLQGFPDQAMRSAHSGVEDARASQHAMSLCYALALAACPIALFVGDLTRQNITCECCLIIRQNMRCRSGALGALAIRGCSQSGAAMSRPD